MGFIAWIIYRSHCWKSLWNLQHYRAQNCRKVAVGIDIRSGQSFDELHGVLDHMKDNGVEYEILFLDAEDSVLVKRYKETRRNHP